MVRLGAERRSLAFCCSITTMNNSMFPITALLMPMLFFGIGTGFLWAGANYARKKARGVRNGVIDFISKKVALSAKRRVLIPVGHGVTTDGEQFACEIPPWKSVGSQVTLIGNSDELECDYPAKIWLRYYVWSIFHHLIGISLAVGFTRMLLQGW